MMKLLGILLLLSSMQASPPYDRPGHYPGDYQPVRTVRLIAHRGESFTAPENTLAAFRLAWELDADAVELDIHLSKDNRVVVIHDVNTRRTSGKDYVVKETSSEVLRTLDAGTFKNESYAGEPIPFLEEAIQLIPPGKTLVIELKSGSDVLPALEEMVRASGKMEQLVFIAFNWGTIAEVRKLFPGNPCYWLSSNKKEVYERLDEAAAIGLDGLNLHFSLIDENLMQEAGLRNLEILAWTVDNPDETRRLFNLGVKAITTNRPAWMREQTAQ